MFQRRLLPLFLLSTFLLAAVKNADAQLAGPQNVEPLPSLTGAGATPTGDALQRQIAFQNQQLELQRRQIQELQRRFESLTPQAPAASTQATGFLVDPNQAPVAAPAAEKSSVVGTDMGSMSVHWNLANGVTFETANKDFTSHIGMRIQEDTVFFNQDAGLKASTANGGIGDLQDGTFFRRVRPSWDGTAYEVIEWNFELALEQTTNNIPNLDEVWVDVTKIPYVGTVRVGHIKVPQGFEGDVASSSKAMTFLERAAYTDAFYQNFAPGIWTGNSVLDQRMTWSGAVYRQENPDISGTAGASDANDGAQFGDGGFGYSGRLTGLPLYTDNGRQLLHLGISGTWRNAINPDPGINGPAVIEFRARPELRDAVGAFGSGTLPGNSQRLVDTGEMQASSATVWGTELFYVRGPFSLQAEYAWAFANNVVVGGVGQGNLGFNGGYVQLSYFLTGENRTYDRRYGRLGTTYIETPYNPFFIVRTEDGGTCWGKGAWELAARYSHLNLNDGPIQGGITDGLEAGVNWYLNTNLKFQFEYLHENRYDRGPSGGVVQNDGTLDGFGTRMQFFF